MERRRHLRRNPSLDDPAARVRMRAGPELAVMNISEAGALVEGATRLLPGTRIDIHLIARDGRRLVRSRVVRAYVSLVQADRIGYHAGLSFEQPVDTRAPAEAPIHAASDAASL